MSRIFKSLVPVEEALERFFRYVPSMPAEEVPLEKALGRVLADDIRSPIDIPPFHRAAFDGYAVKSKDTFGASQSNPITLKVIGTLRPGDDKSYTLGEMEAVEIATGAYLPEGADAVIPLEYTKKMDQFVEIIRQVSPGANVDRKGSDVRVGDLVLRAGTYIGPFEMLMLSSLNITGVKVAKRPQVSIISTGNELVELGSDLKRGQIVNSNRYMISSLISELAEARYRGIARDEENRLESLIAEGTKDDIIVTIAGTSVGKRDLVPKVVESMGGKVIVHGLSIMPGKPTLLAVVGDTPLIGLPGSPVSAAVAGIEILIPALARMLGLRGKFVWPKIRARLSKRIPSRPGVRHYVRVSLSRMGEEVIADPVRVSGSGIISSLTKADGFVVVPEDTEGYEEGQVVEVLVYRRWLEL